MLANSIGNGLAFFFVWLFAVAALHKMRSPAYYQRLIASYGNVARVGRLLVFLVFLVAVCELSVALLVLLPTTRTAGFAGGAMLLLAYAAMMAWQYLRGHSDLACGCAGPESALTVGPALIIRNLVCACLALPAMALAKTLPASPGGAAIALTVAFIAIFFYVCSDLLIANAQAMNQDV